MINTNNNENKKTTFYKKEELLEIFLKKENILNMNNYYVEDNEKYKPTYLIILTIYYIFLIRMDFMANSWIPFILMISSSIILWIYCLLSIIKNDFKKDSNKIVWILLLFLFPISIILYPDFRKIQIIIKEEI